MLTKTQEQINLKEFKEKVINDYRTVSLSREISVMGRRDVLSGKGKFGIFGDGKELPQVVLSHFFKNGDYRSGYYRDGTLLLAQELLSPREIFSTVYGHADVTYERMSGGRQMAGHFLSEMINSSKEWINQTNIKNHISDVSPLATQMSRLVGLGLASKIYRYNNIKNSSKFSNNGNEIVWGSIGNASTSQGVFFESVNACGVLQIPAVISIWDDEYGISVDNKYHTTKESISKALNGFKLTKNQSGIEILKVKGWDYASLIKTYSYAENIARNYHVPVIIHVTELTQPLGHSTSGSHERYKSKERLDWEKSNDCNLKFKEWIIENKLCSQKKLQNIDNEIKKYVTEEKRLAWEYYQRPFLKSRDELLDIFNLFENDYIKNELKKKVESLEEVNFSELLKISRNTIYDLDSSNDIIKNKLLEWNKSKMKLLSEKYSTDLYSIDINDLLKKNFTPPAYDNPNEVDGRIILRDNFDELLKNHDNLFIFGEDVGKIGDVNQGLEGLQKKYGKNRVFDTGIRESTIVGQAIGMALRGLKPIAEIQYLDYILYALQILSDDVATMSYRTHGRQKAPIIIRTRGHRLEGIWHSGSPLGGMINFLRGILILTPRNMTKAAGFYNSLVKLDQPAIVIEPLNGYRTKEKIPSNLGKLETPIGEVDIIKKGKDLTIISYGSTLNIVEKVGQKLLDYDIDCEIIDLQSLIPFDISHRIKKSVAKTNRILIVDEDMPGGASSYILQELLNTQKIYNKLDSEPNLLTAKEHRPPYGSDGDYSSKPSFEDIFEKVYEIMNEVDPNKYSNI
ncbi:MAG TPA: thiamine pyrophosphate-dependent enzyme [Flavobacteriaceae bacterium]|jgi:pyruvate/2-oxoglutarate/acetoin dehydrogenase E1 component/TPP-dependent pyruvate/acetoin dehydrogenase alpha subunit|nr:thiamine pyrophosphate-dependent enzyme [Flavobacteriaceae bacterium]HJO70351.1 thiamine pyrophosphate-dependent enzyme [Flavobacteriaceae bacterium]|tara:strand:+ start:9420 stop:11807 length:2388 start_codon:yes stop_codon:yes gene_type:complete